MHTVVETPAYLASADDEGLSAVERSVIVDYLARNPDAGEIMPGTSGARKVRFAGRGKGKSGGYRVVTFFAGEDIPVFLLDVYGKGSQANSLKGRTERVAQSADCVAARVARANEIEGKQEMTKRKSRVLQGAREALAFAKGEADESAYVIHVPEAIDVKALRAAAQAVAVRFCQAVRI